MSGEDAERKETCEDVGRGCRALCFRHKQIFCKFYLLITSLSPASAEVIRRYFFHKMCMCPELWKMPSCFGRIMRLFENLWETYSQIWVFMPKIPRRQICLRYRGAGQPASAIAQAPLQPAQRTVTPSRNAISNPSSFLYPPADSSCSRARSRWWTRCAEAPTKRAAKYRKPRARSAAR